MSRKVLILAPGEDAHCQAVVCELKKLNCLVTVWSSRSIPQESVLRFELSAKNSVSQITDNAKCFELSEVDAIWLRRPGLPKSPSMPKLWLENLSNWESGRGLEGIFRTLPNTFWVNCPQAQQEALIKVKQLELARELGFTIPHTIVTNDPELVKQFAEQYSNQIVYKLIDEASWQYFPEQELPRGIPTLAFNHTDIEHLQQVKLCLHLFQEKIDKAYDLRVTIIGDEVVAVKIETQEDFAKLDWRLSHNNKLSSYALPDDIAQKCQSFMKKMGLVYGAFDLCRDRSGSYVFFELNPQGQFLWLQEALDLPIAERLAYLLFTGKA